MKLKKLTMLVSVLATLSFDSLIGAQTRRRTSLKKIAQEQLSTQLEKVEGHDEEKLQKAIATLLAAAQALENTESRTGIDNLEQDSSDDENHVNREGESWICAECNEDSSKARNETFYDHMKQHGTNCTICDEEKQYLHPMIEHHEAYHIGIRYKCGDCDSVYFYEKGLLRHQQKKGHSGKSYCCKRCIESKPFENKNDLITHIIKKHRNDLREEQL